MLSLLKRVHWVIFAGILGFLVVLVLVLRSQESPQTVGSKFMDALAKHDSETLADLSYSETKDKTTLKKEWDYAVNEVGYHYRFRWLVSGFTNSSDQSAAVRLMVRRNSDSPSTYAEKFELPLVKREGRWKVPVAQINRKLFPGMPR